MILRCLNDHPTGRCSPELGKMFGKANAHGTQLGSVSFAMEWTGRVLMRHEATAPDCNSFFCATCKRWTEYRLVAPVAEAA